MCLDVFSLQLSNLKFIYTLKIFDTFFCDEGKVNKVHENSTIKTNCIYLAVGVMILFTKFSSKLWLSLQ